jgi:hypothetical protein
MSNLRFRALGDRLFGLIEGIVYLAKSDKDFQKAYVLNKRPWF